MKATLTRVETGPYRDTYYLKCIDCGAEYRSTTYTSKTVPYCYDCRRLRKKERAKTLAETRRCEAERSIRLEVINEMIKELNNCDRYSAETITHCLNGNI